MCYCFVPFILDPLIKEGRLVSSAAFTRGDENEQMREEEESRPTSAKQPLDRWA